MQPKSVVYPVLLALELLRLYLVFSAVLPAVQNSLVWYAALPALCLPAILFFMLALDELRFTLWLPLIALTKALEAFSLLIFALRALPEAIAFGIENSASPASYLPSAGIILALDAFGGLYAHWRNRRLCR